MKQSLTLLLCLLPFLFHCGGLPTTPPPSGKTPQEKTPPPKTEPGIPPVKKPVSSQLWVQRGGSAARENVSSMAIDPAGDIVVVGSFEGQNADFGPFSIDVKGHRNLFVAKLDSAGKWLWVKVIEGEQMALSCEMKIDGEGNIALFGALSKPARFGSLTLDPGEHPGLFVAHLSPEGRWRWARKIETSEKIEHMRPGIQAAGLALDGEGGILVLSESNGKVQIGSERFEAKGRDAFLARLDKDGQWSWARHLGSFFPADVAVGKAGGIFLLGSFSGSLVLGSTRLRSKGSNDLLVARLDSQGNWQWAKRAGSSGIDGGRSLLALPSGDLLLTGFTEHTGDFGPFSSKGLYLADTFVARISAKGEWAMVRHTGNPVYGVATDGKGGIYITGRQLRGGDRLYIKKLDAKGQELWSTTAGSDHFDVGTAVAVDAKGHVYAAGTFTKAESFGGTPLTSKGSDDLFVWKLRPSP